MSELQMQELSNVGTQQCRNAKMCVKPEEIETSGQTTEPETYEKTS